MLDMPAIHIAIDKGDELHLPAMLDATFSDGSISRVNVVWDPVTAEQYGSEGTFQVFGTVADTANRAVATITVGNAVVKRPSQLSVVQNGSDHMDITWTSVPNATSYNVYRATQLYGTYVKVNTANVITNAYTDTSLQAGTTYYYAVSALNTNGESVMSESITAKTGAALIENGAFWYDNNGDKIQAHGGGMIKLGDTYYWFGEDKTTDQPHFYNIKVYTSKDLKSWTFRNNVLTQNSKDTSGNPAPDLANANIERPKILYNESTHKYVFVDAL